MPPTTHFVTSGNEVTLTTDPALRFEPTLEVGTYQIQFAQLRGFYLLRVPDLIVPAKIFGEGVDERCDRIISTFEDRKKATGVLLYGEKGSGKTMQAAVLSSRLLAKGIPTVLVDSLAGGNDLVDFLNKITTPVLVLIDEFEKKTGKPDDDNDQNYDSARINPAMLSLLDGTGTAKHLYLFTTNTLEIDQRLINRPGRIYYMVEYPPLSAAVAKEYGEMYLHNQEHLQEYVKLMAFFQRLSFDIMKAVVEEMNRYKCTAKEAVKWLNASPTLENNSYRVDIVINGEKLSAADFYPRYLGSSPLMDSDDDTKEINFEGVLDSVPHLSIGDMRLDRVGNKGELVYTHTIELTSVAFRRIVQRVINNSHSEFSDSQRVTKQLAKYRSVMEAIQTAEGSESERFKILESAFGGDDDNISDSPKPTRTRSGSGAAVPVDEMAKEMALPKYVSRTLNVVLKLTPYDFRVRRNMDFVAF